VNKLQLTRPLVHLNLFYHVYDYHKQLLLRLRLLLLLLLLLAAFKLSLIRFGLSASGHNMPIQILTPKQQWTSALTRHISGNLSVVASSIIVYHVVLRIRQNLRSPRRDLVTPYHRLMLGFSLADILYSFWAGLSTLVVPASSGVIYGFGTTATCSMQGFFMQFWVSTHLYIATLSIYFLLKIRHNVTDDTLYHRYEIWFHAIPWVVAIGTGAVGVASQAYNPMVVPEMGCWAASFPTGCLDPGGPPCTRGYRNQAQGSLYVFVLAYSWLFACFVVVLVSNIMIYRTVRYQERRNEQYLGSKLQLQSQLALSAVRISNLTGAAEKKHEQITPPVASGELPAAAAGSNEKIAAVCDELDGTERESGRVESSTTLEYPSSSAHLDHTATGSHRRQSATWQSAKASRTACTQSILYVSTAGFTVVWIFLPFLFYQLDLSNGWLFFSVLMVCAVAPLQGVFNLMIFVRLEYLRLRRKGFSRLKCIRTCLFSPDLRDPRFFRSRRQVV
jgi:hypothetical protein